MTFQEFIDKNNGQFLDFDNSYGAQCMDLHRFYVRDVLDLPQTPSVPSAYMVWDNAGDFEKISGRVPLRGDVVIFGQGFGEHGHIAIVIEATDKMVTVFEQNVPLGSPCRIAKHSYKHITGYLRPKGITKNTIILVSKAENIKTYKQGIARYISKVNILTDSKLLYEVFYHDTDLAFHTTRRKHVVFVEAFEIANEGAKAEEALGIQANTVCLIYNPDEIVGEFPTNPVQNAIFYAGFTTTQLPTNWLGKEKDVDIPAELFFAHEDSHSNFYLVNLDREIRDKTHDVVKQTADYNSIDYFLDLLLELKDDWDSLRKEEAKPTKPTNPTNKYMQYLKENDNKLVQNAGTGSIGLIKDGKVLVTSEARAGLLALTTLIRNGQGGAVPPELWSEFPKEDF